MSEDVPAAPQTSAPHEWIEGVRCFAPQLARSAADYPPEAFAKLAPFEDRHFWFQSRNEVLRSLVTKHLGGRTVPASFLEIGCGTGFVLKMLAELPFLHCIGAEINLAGVALARARVPEVEIVQLDAAELPFEGQFDGVGLFDVLEHIEGDGKVLESIRHALKPGGLLFLSVPQHRFLWSVQDEIARHKRRYKRSDLAAELGSKGFHIEFMTSFCATPFPLMLLARWRRNLAAPEQEPMAALLAELDLRPSVNRLLRTLMKADEFLIRRGCSLPFGGSLLVVARS